MSTDYIEILHGLVLSSQPGTEVTIEDLNSAEFSSDLGLDSLTLVLLLGEYLQEKNLDPGMFDPEWLLELTTVSGIVTVLKRIDTELGCEVS